MKNLDVNYDYVCIIDCLPQSQRDKYKISEDLGSFLDKKGINKFRCSCNSKIAVKEAFDYLLKEADKGIKFLLQIVSHGTENGLFIEDTNDDILWCELCAQLQKLNNKMSNTLIVNMTSCRGLNGAKIVDISETNYPFFGLIGCARDLYVWEGKIVNELFYEGLIDNQKINELIPQIQQELKKQGTTDNVVYCITSEGYKFIRKTIDEK